MGVDEGNAQVKVVMDVEMIMGNCPITTPTVHAYY